MKLLALAVLLAAAAQDRPPDLVVVNGRVLTVDAKFSVAEAVAIRDGVFILVGTNGEAMKLVTSKTRVLDAKGRTVVPGLIDSHVHALGAASNDATEPFVYLRTIPEIQEWIRRKAAAAPEGQWIRLPRNYPTRLRERRFPTRAELDAPAPRHPVVFDGAYVQFLNTAALKAAGITRDTPDPAGGEIVRDGSGEPTGLLRNPRALLSKFLPGRTPSEGETLEALERVHRRYNEVGITSVFERQTDVAGVRTYEKLRDARRLTVRATVTIGMGGDGTADGSEKFIASLPFKTGDGDDWVRVGPLKLVVDGGILIGNAFMREPYGVKCAHLYAVTDPAYRGSLSLKAEQVRNMIRTGHRLGWQMSSHVTGDAGTDIVLDAVEAANADSPIRDRRYTLIHSYFPNPEAARRAAALGVCVDTQPAWYFKDADAIVTALGEERLKAFIGVGDWLKAGVKVAINTDHMFGLDPDTALNPFNPFLTMATVVTRRTEAGLVINPDQRVSREDALRMMTIHAAWLGFDEKKKGSIEVGKFGDLAILTGDFMACPEDRIRELQVAATVVGGRVVFERK